MSENQNANITFDKEDIEKNKISALLAYFIFFIPLLTCPESRYGRYHANQSLLNTLLALAASVIAAITCGIGAILTLAPIAFAIIGIINVCNDEAKPLPLIGKYTLIKLDKE